MPNKHQSSAAQTHAGPRWLWYCQSHPTATAPQHQCASDTRRALRHPTAGLTPKPNATVTKTPHIHHPTSTTANASTAAQRRHGHPVPSPSEVPGFGVTQRTSPPADAIQQQGTCTADPKHTARTHGTHHRHSGAGDPPGPIRHSPRSAVAAARCPAHPPTWASGTGATAGLEALPSPTADSNAAAQAPVAGWDGEPRDGVTSPRGGASPQQPNPPPADADTEQPRHLGHAACATAPRNARRGGPGNRLWGHHSHPKHCPIPHCGPHQGLGWHRLARDLLGGGPCPHSPHLQPRRAQPSPTRCSPTLGALRHRRPPALGIPPPQSSAPGGSVGSPPPAPSFPSQLISRLAPGQPQPRARNGSDPSPRAPGAPRTPPHRGPGGGGSSASRGGAAAGAAQGNALGTPSSGRARLRAG